MKVGKLRSWNEAGYGLVIVSVKEKYFLHASNISQIPDDLTEPVIGSEVQFEVAPPYKNGKLHQAVNAVITSPVVKAEGGAL